MAAKASKGAAGAARVPSEAELAQVAEMAEVQCPREEVMRALGMPSKEGNQFFKLEAVRKAYETGVVRGIIGLRKAQFKLAATSAPMATLLGKLYLDQGEGQDKDDRVAIESVGATERVRARIVALLADRRGLDAGAGGDAGAQG